jgi:hypothetical protein
MNGQAGKGDSRRPSSINDEQFAANWHRAFGTKEQPCGPGTMTAIGSLSLNGSTDGFTPLCTKHTNADGHFIHPCPTCLDINNPKHAATAVVDLRNFIGSVSPALEHEIKFKL